MQSITILSFLWIFISMLDEANICNLTNNSDYYYRLNPSNFELMSLFKTLVLYIGESAVIPLLFKGKKSNNSDDIYKVVIRCTPTNLIACNFHGIYQKPDFDQSLETRINITITFIKFKSHEIISKLWSFKVLVLRKYLSKNLKNTSSNFQKEKSLLDNPTTIMSESSNFVIYFMYAICGIFPIIILIGIFLLKIRKYIKRCPILLTERPKHCCCCDKDDSTSSICDDLSDILNEPEIDKDSSVLLKPTNPSSPSGDNVPRVTQYDEKSKKEYLYDMNGHQRSPSSCQKELPDILIPFYRVSPTFNHGIHDKKDNEKNFNDSPTNFNIDNENDHYSKYEDHQNYQYSPYCDVKNYIFDKIETDKTFIMNENFYQSFNDQKMKNEKNFEENETNYLEVDIVPPEKERKKGRKSKERSHHSSKKHRSIQKRNSQIINDMIIDKNILENEQKNNEIDSFHKIHLSEEIKTKPQNPVGKNHGHIFTFEKENETTQDSGTKPIKLEHINSLKLKDKDKNKIAYEENVQAVSIDKNKVKEPPVLFNQFKYNKNKSKNKIKSNRCYSTLDHGDVAKRMEELYDEKFIKKERKRSEKTLRIMKNPYKNFLNEAIEKCAIQEIENTKKSKKNKNKTSNSKSPRKMKTLDQDLEGELETFKKSNKKKEPLKVSKQTESKTSDLPKRFLLETKVDYCERTSEFLHQTKENYISTKEEDNEINKYFSYENNYSLKVATEYSDSEFSDLTQDFPVSVYATHIESKKTEKSSKIAKIKHNTNSNINNSINDESYEYFVDSTRKLILNNKKDVVKQSNNNTIPFLQLFRKKIFFKNPKK